MSGHAGSSKETCVLLYTYYFLQFLVLFFPVYKGFSLIFQLFLVWGKT